MGSAAVSSQSQPEHLSTLLSILSTYLIFAERQTLAVDALLAAAAQLVRVNRVGVAVAAAVQAPALGALLQYIAQCIMITYLTRAAVASST